LPEVMSASQTQWHGLHKKEYQAVRCCTVVGDLKADGDVASLQEKRLNGASSGEYLNAHSAKMGLKKRFEEECLQQKKNLETRYKEEYDAFDMDQLGAFTHFNADSERQLQEYDARAQESMSKFTEQQKESHAKYMEKLQAETLPKRPRWSPELLRLRKVESLLVKQCEYTQAHMRKKKVDELEANEKAHWEKERNRKIKALETHFLQKQADEMTNVKKKIATARQELVTKQNKELDRLHFYKSNHEAKLASNRKVAVKRALTETDRVAYARQLCGFNSSAGLRP